MAFRASPEEKTDLLVRIHHVCRSPLAGGGARAVMQAVAVAFRGLWKNTTGLTAEQAADRLAQNNTMHLLYGILVLLFILIAFQSWRKWLEWGDWCLLCTKDLFTDHKEAEHIKAGPKGVRAGAKAPPMSAIDVLADEDGLEMDEKKEGVIGKCPDFPLAIRSKLLVGPSTYDITKNPLYEHFFERLTDFFMEEAALARIEAKEKEAMNAMKAMMAALPTIIPTEQTKREERRRRARAMLDRHGEKLIQHGETTQHVQREIQTSRFEKALAKRKRAEEKERAKEERRRRREGSVYPASTAYYTETVAHGTVREEATGPDDEGQGVQGYVAQGVQGVQGYMPQGGGQAFMSQGYAPIMQQGMQQGMEAQGYYAQEYPPPHAQISVVPAHVPGSVEASRINRHTARSVTPSDIPIEEPDGYSQRY